MRRAVPWLLLLFATAYAGALAATFRSLVRALYSSADVASAPLLGELWPDAPGNAVMVLGHVPGYEGLWAEWLTRNFPFHRVLWEVGPWIASLAGIALVACATVRVAGRLAALLAAVPLACAGYGLLSFQFPARIHALVWVHVCVLGAFLGFAGRRRLHPLLWVALAVVTAIGVGSDELLLVAGVAPFVLGSTLLGRRALAAAAAVAVVSVAGGEAIAAAMRSFGFRVVAYPFTLARRNDLLAHLRLLERGLFYLLNGNAVPRTGARFALGLACEAVLVGAVLLGLWYAARERRGDCAQAAYVAFWIAAGVLLVAGFVGTNVPVDRFSARYLVGLAYAIVVVAAVAAAQSGPALQAAAAIGASVLVAGSIVSLAARDLQHDSVTYPTPALAAQLAAFARGSGLRYGYGGYWDAEPLSWNANLRVQIYPVSPCLATVAICPYPWDKISSWYVPRPGTKTFVVLDPIRPTGFEQLVSTLGKPERSVHIGRLIVVVYGYDVASRFGAA